MAEKRKAPTAEGAKKENRFTKEQLLSSKRFRDRKDILDALLEDGKKYTVSDAELLIEKYMKGKVK